MKSYKNPFGLIGALLLLILLCVEIPISRAGEQMPTMTPPRALTDQSEDASIPYKARHDGHVFVGGNAPAAKSISNPLHGDAKSIEAGKQLFTSMHCDGCHGLGALGWEGPSLADGRWHYGASSAEIFESIYAGRPNGMPAYGGTLPRHSLWQLVTYLQSLTPATDPATTRYPP